ncbi:MAG: ABC transporter ATP-binding protein [Christensenellales bacterium]
MRKQKKKSELWKLVKFYKKYLKFLILTFILSGTYTALSVCSTILSGNLLDSFTNFVPENTVKIAIILCLTCIVIEGVTNLWSRTVLKLNSSVDFDIKQKMLESLMKLKIKNFDNLNSGVFVARINKDSYNLSELFDEITDDLSTILLNVSFIIYSFFINIYLGLFLLLNIIVIYLWECLKNKYYLKKHIEYKRLDEQVVGSYGEVIRGIRDIKNLDIKEPINDKLNKEQYNTIQAQKDQIHTRRTWNRYREVIKHIFDLFFILLSCYMIVYHNLKIGDFLILFMYKTKIQSFVNSISNIKEKLADGEVSAHRVFEIIEDSGYSKETFGNKKLNKAKGRIEFRNVKFSYDNTILFKDLSFTINPNEIVAFVGKSGEGKSTIINLINKNYSINSGEILIDNINIEELDEESIRKNISIVPQVPYIFNMTIKDNLRLVKPDASMEEIIKVCKDVGIAEFIESLPLKYNSYIGENGLTLSGGQRQRLAIARCLLKESKIILLDEATSALDNETQNKINNVIQFISKNHTVIVIAHRLSTIINSDRIFVLNNHKIEAIGTHNELLETNSTYKKFYKDFTE